MSHNEGKEYGVGHKKPPVHSRWKKGQSGNPNGRRKGKVTLVDMDDVFDEVLAALVAVNENGRPQKMSKLRAFATQVVNKGIKGDGKAASLLMSHLARRAARKDGDPSVDEMPHQQSRQEFDALFDQMAANLRKRPGFKKPDNDDMSSEPGGASARPPEVK
jgi:hypothetical protein